jgi:inner membrane transporter RhtA
MTGSTTPEVAARRVPAPALVALSAISAQSGGAIATTLIRQVGPAGAVTLRLVFATVALLVAVRPGRADIRRLADRRNLAVMLVFGLALGGMNLLFYESIQRIPLGVAVTLEFTGPLALSVISSRRWTDVLWAAFAGGSVFLLAGGSLLGAGHRLDKAGVGLALLTGAFWAGYILANKETGRRFPGASGLAGAMAVAAALMLPFGVVQAGGRLLHPGVLGVGAAVAVLSSALPYSFEMAALRRVTPRTFGILVSISPALAAVAGFVVVGQRLSGLEVVALVLVVVANAGNAWSSGRQAALAPGQGPEPPLPA